MVHHDGETLALLSGQPVERARRNCSAGVLQGDAVRVDRERHPRKRHAVEGGERQAVAELLAEGRHDAERSAACSQQAIEAPPTTAEQGRRVPEPQREAQQVALFARMPAARRQVVVAVDDGDPRGVEEAACAERVEGAFEQRRVPPVEEIAGDDQMIDRLRGDAVELTIELDCIAFISQMKI